MPETLTRNHVACDEPHRHVPIHRDAVTGPLPVVLIMISGHTLATAIREL